VAPLQAAKRKAVRLNNLVADSTWIWQSGPGGLTLDHAVVSFQRFLRPAIRTVRKAPRSYGVLPVAAMGTNFMLALPEQEAFWLGVTVPSTWSGGAWNAAALNTAGKLVDLERISRPGTFVIPGMRRPNGEFEVLCRENVSQIQLVGPAGVAHILVCSPETFARRSHQAPPEPFDPNAAYGGWRLP
jgi:hypothetical protein